MGPFGYKVSSLTTTPTEQLANFENLGNSFEGKLIYLQMQLIKLNDVTRTQNRDFWSIRRAP